MNNKEAIAILTHNWKYRELIDNGYQYEALELAIKALEERPIDDLSEYSDKLWQKAYERGKAEARPQGEWIEKVERRGCFAGDKTVYSYTCPFCGAKEFKKYPFCHCGADMRKENAENE